MTRISPEIDLQIARYAAGPAELRSAIGNLSCDQVRQQAAPGKWSVLEVVCHLSDFELVYADRMKRILAEERPTMFSGDPDQFAAALAYDQRDLEEELQVITAVRQQIVRLLRTLDASAFEREGIHTADGPLTLATLLKRIAGHIPHHAEFIRQKHQNL
jgi:uncharacterized damage-inducible protein DinB